MAPHLVVCLCYSDSLRGSSPQRSVRSGLQFLTYSLAAAGAAGGFYFAKQAGVFDKISDGKSASIAPKVQSFPLTIRSPYLASCFCMRRWQAVLQAPTSKEGDYDAVRKVVSDMLERDEHYDDGRCQPRSGTSWVEVCSSSTGNTLIAYSQSH